MDWKLLENQYNPEEAETYGVSSGRPQPPLFEEWEGETILLPRDFRSVIRNNDLYDVMEHRRSRRLYEEDPLSLQELSFLLYYTQGVREITGLSFPVSVRTVPSAGSRHALKTWLFVNRVEELQPGWYRYLPEQHCLGNCSRPEDAAREADLLREAFCGQSFFSGSAVCFLWSTSGVRMEWRYGPQAPKLILLDAGHVCQNLYLAGSAIGCGVCANTSYLQEKADRLLAQKGGDETEHVIYAASVGKAF